MNKENLVKCSNCGGLIERNHYRRTHLKHYFCNRICYEAFRAKTSKTPRQPAVKLDRRQIAFGVSQKIAEAYRTGEWK